MRPSKSSMKIIWPLNNKRLKTTALKCIFVCELDTRYNQFKNKILIYLIYSFIIRFSRYTSYYLNLFFSIFFFIQTASTLPRQCVCFFVSIKFCKSQFIIMSNSKFSPELLFKFVLKIFTLN